MSHSRASEQGDYVLFSPCVRRREELLRTHMRPVSRCVGRKVGAAPAAFAGRRHATGWGRLRGAPDARVACRGGESGCVRAQEVNEHRDFLGETPADVFSRRVPLNSRIHAVPVSATL